MTPGAASRGPMFSNTVLWALLAVSVITNVVVLARTAPIDWHRAVHRDQPVPAVTDADHVRGPSAARVTIIEYSDFQCPFCARFHEVLKAAVTADPDVRWVYRHLPLSSVHPMARPAAEAAECASEQGRFWEYADLLFQQQERLDDALLTAAARTAGLDAGLFDACRRSGRASARAVADATAFEEGHLAGTPVSFINGVRLEGAVSEAVLQKAIAAAR